MLGTLIFLTSLQFGAVLSKTEQIEELATVFRSFCSQSESVSGYYEAVIDPKGKIAGLAPQSIHAGTISYKCPSSFHVDLSLPMMDWTLITNGNEAWIIRKSKIKTEVTVEEYPTLEKRKLGTLLRALRDLLDPKSSKARMASLAEELKWERIKGEDKKAYSIELRTSLQNLPRLGLTLQTLNGPQIQAFEWEDNALRLRMTLHKPRVLAEAKDPAYYHYLPQPGHEIEVYDDNSPR